MKKLLKKRYFIPLAVVAVMAIGAVAAYAAWTSQVSASGKPMQSGTIALSNPTVTNATPAVVLMPTAVVPSANASYTDVTSNMNSYPNVDFQTAQVTNSSTTNAENVAVSATTGDPTWDANLVCDVWVGGNLVVNAQSLASLNVAQSLGALGANATAGLTMAVWLPWSVTATSLENGQPTITFTATASQTNQ